MSQTPFRVLIAGAGYAGLHAALRLSEDVSALPLLEVVVLDQHPYHQVITELPRVAAGTRPADAVRLPTERLLGSRVRFVEATLTAFDLAGSQVRTTAGVLPFTRLMVALGSRPNDFAIPGLEERTIPLYSVEDAERVWQAAQAAVRTAAQEPDRDRQRQLATIVIGGGGATGVELAGELAETLPELAEAQGLAPSVPRVVLVEASPAILAGSSPGLVERAQRLLDQLHVEVRTNARIAIAVPDGFQLQSGELVRGGLFLWAGGVKAPAVLADAGLPTGHNGRLKVDQYLRVLDHPTIYAAGDAASVIDPTTGHVVPPLAQIALDEGNTVAENLRAELRGEALRPFALHDRGTTVSVGPTRGVAELSGRAFGGRLAHMLKDAIEWEYRTSVQHLRGWSPI
ncbi:MAG TPA: NAD(P)/FAD-dependent oxidoreductase [Chloroflexota bacterium]|jgi:NADH dehydrogenase